jgi:SAM-dependent methyltransferase
MKIITLFKIIINFFSYLVSFPKWILIAKKKGFSFKIHARLLDNTVNTNFDRHYVYHVAWALTQVTKNLNRKVCDRHVDIASSLYFVTGIANNFKIDFVDVRPPNIEYPNVNLITGDVTHLPYSDNSLDSLSMLHVLEHLGLGRYGDTVDEAADLKAAYEISRVMKTGGLFYLVTPTGKPSIHYNAHRVYSVDMVKQLFNGFELQKFDFLKERDGGILENCDVQTTIKEAYGCGMYVFRKL